MVSAIIIIADAVPVPAAGIDDAGVGVCIVVRLVVPPRFVTMEDSGDPLCFLRIAPLAATASDLSIGGTALTILLPLAAVETTIADDDDDDDDDDKEGEISVIAAVSSSLLTAPFTVPNLS